MNLIKSIDDSNRKIMDYVNINSIIIEQEQTNGTMLSHYMAIESICPKYVQYINKNLYTCDISPSMFNETHSAAVICLEQITNDMMDECQQEIVEIINYYITTLTTNSIITDEQFINKEMILNKLSIPLDIDLSSFKWSCLIDTDNTIINVQYMDGDNVKNIQYDYPPAIQSGLSDLLITQYDYKSPNIDDMCRFISLIDSDLVNYILIDDIDTLISLNNTVKTGKSIINNTTTHKSIIVSGITQFITLLSTIYGTYNDYNDFNNRLTNVIDDLKNNTAINDLNIIKHPLSMDEKLTNAITTPWLTNLMDIMNNVLNNITTNTPVINITNRTNYTLDVYKQYVNFKRLISSNNFINSICRCIELFQIKQ